MSRRFNFFPNRRNVVTHALKRSGFEYFVSGVMADGKRCEFSGLCRCQYESSPSYDRAKVSQCIHEALTRGLLFRDDEPVVTSASPSIVVILHLCQGLFQILDQILFPIAWNENALA